MKTVIYSQENPVSVKKVKDMKARHPKFTFLEVGETEAIKAVMTDGVSIIIELDKPKAEKPAPKPKVAPAPVKKVMPASLAGNTKKPAAKPKAKHAPKPKAKPKAKPEAKKKK